MITPYLDVLKTAAGQAEIAEGQYRREAAARIAALERERAFAFRRFNLMRAVTEAVAGAEDENIAVARAIGVVSGKLGWHADSAARDEVLSRFAPVGLAVFASLAPDKAEPGASVQDALAAFETWYAESHPVPFWALFEHYIPETPRVDF